jgi:DNA polymerase epsilon subunit 1
MRPHVLCRLQKNHLSGLKRKLLKVSFYNVQQLMEVRREITPTVNRNSKRSTMADAVAALAQQDAGNSSGRPRVREPVVTQQTVQLGAAVWATACRCCEAHAVRCCVCFIAAGSSSRNKMADCWCVLQDVLEYIEGMREHDVPYHVRFAIDTGAAHTGTGPPQASRTAQ